MADVGARLRRIDQRLSKLTGSAEALASKIERGLPPSELTTADIALVLDAVEAGRLGLDGAALDAELLRRAEARADLLSFVQYVFRGYEVARHHALIAARLEDVEAGRCTRLCISMPPRHGKSLLASILFPSWYLGRHPDHRLIAVSYSSELSFAFSRQARNILAGPSYSHVFGASSGLEHPVVLAQDSRAVAGWDVAGRRGGYVSAGVGGSITGRGANVLLIDDPLKDAQEASSQAVRDTCWDWFTTTAYTRLEDNGAIVLIMTRWHEADLAGRVLQAAQDDPSADQWTYVRLPALAEAGDVLGRAEGAALWPSKYDRTTLESIRTTLGSRAFSALYMQAPAPAEGAIFKHDWWRYYDRDAPLPAFSRVVQSWDTAQKTGQENDYSACVTMGLSRADNTLYMLDFWQGKLEFPALVAGIQQQYERWAGVPGCKPHEVLIEDKVSGTSAFQTLKMTTHAPVIAIKPEGDKIARANAATPYYESGRVLHPDGAAWLGDYELALERFPTAAHDDAVDATTLAVNRLMSTQRRPVDAGGIAAANIALTSPSKWRGVAENPDHGGRGDLASDGLAAAERAHAEQTRAKEGQHPQPRPFDRLARPSKWRIG